MSAIDKAGTTERATIRQAVRATTDYQGILGVPLTFDDKGDVAGGIIFIYQVKGNTFRQVKIITVK